MLVRRKEVSKWPKDCFDSVEKTVALFDIGVDEKKVGFRVGKGPFQWRQKGSRVERGL